MKQYSKPILIKGTTTVTLEKLELNTNGYDESWIQDICFQNPSWLPVEELEPTFGGMIPICRELATESGFADLVYVNEYGFITLGECKLWRNPEARRKVIGQILDYAKDLAKWDYSKFESECLKARKETTKTLFEIVQGYYPDTEEATFIDRVQSNLKKGRFLLAIIGDGIRENMEELANYIHRNGNLNFTLALIEIPIYQNPTNKELIITPRILAKTKEIERIIYKIKDREVEDSPETDHEITFSKTISEKVFFERLQNSIGKKSADEFQEFIEVIKSDLHLYTKLGRGKRLSLNLKSSNDIYNFASIQEDGEVWFYGIVTKTGQLGDKQIGINYLKHLAKLVNGRFHDLNQEWHWCIKKNGKYIKLPEYLAVKQRWQRLISETLDQINKFEENV